MATEVDIVVFGTGSFAGRIVFDLAAAASKPVRVAIAGRNTDRLNWLRVAANARAALFGRPATFTAATIDLHAEDAAASLLARLRPRVVVQAASAQPASVISSTGDAWSELVAEGGLSASAIFQALLSLRVARAVQQVDPKIHLINCCFPDVVNSLITAAGLPITCGVGNVAILSNAFAGGIGVREPGRLKVLMHYQVLGAWRRPPAARSGPAPRVWLDGAEIDDVFGRFSGVRLTAEPAVEISGASGVPLMLAMAANDEWVGHVPGPAGLPGGYPVAFRDRSLGLDLPAGIDTAAAVAWNAQFEKANGLVVEADGRARYTGLLYERLRQESPDLAEGFAAGDVEAVYAEMAELRARLQALPPR
jgi:hypothetical protein